MGFKKLTMSFRFKTQSILLKGLSFSYEDLVDNQEMRVSKKSKCKGLWLQMLDVSHSDKQDQIPSVFFFTFVGEI